MNWYNIHKNHKRILYFMLCNMQAWWGYELYDFLRAILQHDLTPLFKQYGRKIFSIWGGGHGNFTEGDIQSLASSDIK
jgi:hypothetical protein